MSDQDLGALLKELKEEQARLREELAGQRKPGKDNWDKLNALAPIISGLLISTMAGYFTYSYNQQQLRLQEIQTIEKFIPHMMEGEASKKAAILAISSLKNTELAARFARLFASEGTVSALKSIATTGDSKDRLIAQDALAKALDNIAARYSLDNKYQEAEQALKEALQVRQESVGPDHPDLIGHVQRLAEFYKTHGRYLLAEPLFKRALALKEKNYGPTDGSVAESLKSLAELYQLQGKPALAEPLYKRAAAIDQGMAVKRPEAAAESQGEVPVVEEPLKESERAVREEAKEGTETAPGADAGPVRDKGTPTSSRSPHASAGSLL